MRNALFLTCRILIMVAGQIISFYLFQHGSEMWGELMGGCVILFGVLTGNFQRAWSLSLSVISALWGLVLIVVVLRNRPEHYILYTTFFAFSIAMFVIRYIASFRGSLRRVMRRTDWR